MALPQGWAVATLGDVASYANGRAFKPTEWETQGLPIIRIQNLNNADAKYNYSRERFQEKYLVRTGDLLFAWSASLGSFIWRGGDAWLNQHIFKVLPYDGVSKWYLYYYLLKTIAEFYSKTHGSGMVHITSAPFKETSLALPPLPEQHRIVAKIDALFSELDKGVEMLQTVRAQLRTYRQAVLKWAFEGRLSEQWRTGHLSSEKLRSELKTLRLDTIREEVDGSETHLATCDLWQWVSIGDLFKVEVGATPSRKQASYWNGSIYWVSSGEVKFNRIFVTEESITGDGLQHTSTNVHPIGTVLLAMIGEGKTRGRASILKVPAAHNQNTAAILVGAQLSSEYLYYYLQYNYQNTRRVGSGNNQKALNKERVRMLPFPYTVKEEQDLIVAEIESRLSVCDKLEQLVDETLTKAQALRQSILKKAFAGELVPQDPNDEPAEKLLERIKAMKAAAAKTTTTGRTRK